MAKCWIDKLPCFSGGTCDTYGCPCGPPAVTCIACKGSGWEDYTGDSNIPCEICGNRGHLLIKQDNPTEIYLELLKWDWRST